MSVTSAAIYTDGSCHTQKQLGGWAAIIFYKGQKTIIKDMVSNTSHNRMELVAVIEAIRYVQSMNAPPDHLNIYTDSQYVVGLPSRFSKLKKNHFMTAKGSPVRNHDLIGEFMQFYEKYTISCIKVKAHQKKTDKTNYNREVDKISRKLVRDAVNKSIC